MRCWGICESAELPQAGRFSAHFGEAHQGSVGNSDTCPEAGRGTWDGTEVRQ